jgi:hypothetical protein
MKMKVFQFFHNFNIYNHEEVFLLNFLTKQ